eukprot:4425362-Pyramimonas_sp.AAC.1
MHHKLERGPGSCQSAPKLSCFRTAVISAQVRSRLSWRLRRIGVIRASVATARSKNSASSVGSTCSTKIPTPSGSTWMSRLPTASPLLEWSVTTSPCR